MAKQRAIKNYTTSIPALKSVGEITSFLASRGVQAVQIEYEPMPPGTPGAISFSIDIDGRRWFYRLPCRAEGVLKTLKRDRVEPRYSTMEHARAVAWRIVRDWVEAQFALIDAGAADLGEVFLPYLLCGPSETIYGRFLRQGGALLLGEAKHA